MPQRGAGARLPLRRAPHGPAAPRPAPAPPLRQCQVPEPFPALVVPPLPCAESPGPAPASRSPAPGGFCPHPFATASPGEAGEPQTVAGNKRRRQRPWDGTEAVGTRSLR